MKPFWWELLTNMLSVIGWSSVLATILILTIRDWLRTSPRVLAPAWRTYFAVGAITVLSFSELLWTVSAVWIAVQRGASYNPVFQWIGALGFFAAPTALLAGLFGKGKLRWPACGLSVLMMYSWLALGLSDL
jgi:hypothetical protein